MTVNNVFSQRLVAQLDRHQPFSLHQVILLGDFRIAGRQFFYLGVRLRLVVKETHELDHDLVMLEEHDPAVDAIFDVGHGEDFGT
jgi:hypothetical protein